MQLLEEARKDEKRTKNRRELPQTQQAGTPQKYRAVLQNYKHGKILNYVNITGIL